jgi:hypothetical protein
VVSRRDDDRGETVSDHRIEKPTLFISHATSDGEFAVAVKEEIERVFANGLKVYCTSSPGAIEVGKDWLGDVETKLNEAQALIVLITPVSVERSWLWFELGASWARARLEECRIYPLCAPEIEPGSIPAPLDRLQALSMGSAQELRILMNSLIDQFGFGTIESFEATNITERIPRYASITISDIDRNERALYSGKYTGYSDDELTEVIDYEYMYSAMHDSITKTEKRVSEGRLIRFRDVDAKLDLPPGSARRLMNKVAKRYRLVPLLQTDHLVRYQEEMAGLPMDSAILLAAMSSRPDQRTSRSYLEDETTLAPAEIEMAMKHLIAADFVASNYRTCGGPHDERKEPYLITQKGIDFALESELGDALASRWGHSGGSM